MNIKKLVIIIILTVAFIKSINGQRSHHASIISNNTLYILAGYDVVYNETADFLKLDLTQQFITTDASSTPLGKLPKLPILTSDAVITDFEKSNVLMLIGGARPNGGALMYTFDTSSLGPWVETTAKYGLTPPTYMTSQMAVRDNENNVYLYGGSNTSSLYIYSRNTDEWLIKGPFEGFVVLQHYEAVLMSNGKIAYIGGASYPEKVLQPMDQIPLYDTVLASWSLKNATGEVPDTRISHQVVIVPDGRIIVYGGRKLNNDSVNVLIANLELVNEEFIWSRPNIVNHPYRKRWAHSTNLSGKYLINTFGYYELGKFVGGIGVDLIDVSDRNKYVGTTTFEPSTYITPNKSAATSQPNLSTSKASDKSSPSTSIESTTPTETNQPGSPIPSLISLSEKENRAALIVASVLGSAIGVTVVLGIGYFAYRKLKLCHATPTSGMLFTNNDIPIHTPGERELRASGRYRGRVF